MKKIILKIFIIFFTFSLAANEVKILEENLGTGLEVVNHSKVTVHYKGRLEDKTEFDASEEELDQEFNQETDEELLDIPTFLRRQAN